MFRPTTWHASIAHVHPSYSVASLSLLCRFSESCCSDSVDGCASDSEETCVSSFNLALQFGLQLDPIAADQCFSLMSHALADCGPSTELAAQVEAACSATFVGGDAQGAPCSTDATCAPQLEGASVCLPVASSTGDGTCQTVPWSQEGDACGSATEGRCTDGLLCGEASGTCEPERSQGDACSRDSECSSGACDMGVCSEPEIEELCEFLSTQSDTQ